jgi:hypothetical protein
MGQMMDLILNLLITFNNFLQNMKCKKLLFKML